MTTSSDNVVINSFKTVNRVKTAYMFLADGFEEIEAIVPIDILRRAGICVHTVGVNGQLVTGAHGVPIVADMEPLGFELPQDADMVIFPGGEGVALLRESVLVKAVLEAAVARNIYIAAICAAPLLLNDNELLNGICVTAFPTVQKELSKSVVTGGAVEQVGNIITARSAGVCLQFSQVLATILVGEQTAQYTMDNLYP